MNHFDDILDNSVEDEKKYFRLTEPVDRGLHCLMDMAIISILTGVIVKALISILPEFQEKFPDEYIQIIWLGIYLAYYFLFEFYAQATIGKLVRRTRVMTLNEEKPSALQTLIRTITRLIPIGFFMLYTPYNIPLHDFASKTRVQKKLRDHERRITHYAPRLKKRNFRG